VKGRLVNRYWSSLTGSPQAATPPGRGRAGYSFVRRYIAALLGISLPPHPPQPQQVAISPAPPASQMRRGTRWRLVTGLVGAAGCTMMAMVSVSMNATPPLAGPPAAHVGGADGPRHSSGMGLSPPVDTIEFDLWNGDSVPWCTTLEGSGSRPPEDDAVLMVRPNGYDMMYYAARLEFGGNRWRASDVVIGTPTDGDRSYELRIYAVTPDVANALATSEQWLTDIPGQWLASQDVVRANDPGYC